MSERKARSRLRLIDRYYGKKDILASWEHCPPFSCMKQLREAPEADPVYLRELSRRIHCCHVDLAYRGVDGFSELALGSADHQPPL